jgi:hypothetical protein
MRKAFTISERVAILRSMDNRVKTGRPKKTCQYIDKFSDTAIKLLDRDDATRKAGLGNHTTAYEAEKVVDEGIIELVAAVDNKDISVHNAFIIAREPEDAQARIMALPGEQRKAAIARLRETHRERTAAKKVAKKSGKKPVRGSARNVIHMPTYNPNRNPLTDEERGIPPRETWDEPDPDRPGLNRIQGYTAKHGHVHIMPLARRQAQDRRAAAADLGTRLRDLDKAVQAFLGGDKPLVTAADLADVLTMPSKDTGMIIPRITERMAVLRASCDTLADYLDTVDAVLNREGREETA